MKRFELGIALDYCKDWDSVKAINELYQNVIDESVTSEGRHPMSVKTTQSTIALTSEGALLKKESILMGVSTKTDDDKTIGRHGEGYKVAIAVLLRLGYEVEIVNGLADEVWSCHVINSRRYQRKIPVIDITKKKTDFKGLTFRVIGMTTDDWRNLHKRNLKYCQQVGEDLGDIVETEYGICLRDKKYKGQVFISGLYVCHSNLLNWGYSFNPDMLRLDRDRLLVDSIDLQFTCSKLIGASTDANFIEEAGHVWEGSYLHLYNKVQVEEQVANKYYREFQKEHGSSAVPVTNNSEFNDYSKLGYKPVMVKDSEAYFIKKSPEYKPATTIEENTINRFNSWKEKVSDRLSEGELEEIKQILSVYVNFEAYEN